MAECSESQNAVLIIDTPERSGNLLYAAGYYCIDPIVYLRIGSGNSEQSYGFFPATELEHARLTAKVQNAEDLTETENRTKEEGINPDKRHAGCVVDILRDHHIQTVDVPEDFPIIEADFLRKMGFSLNVVGEPFFRSRSTKSADELSHIRENSRLNSQVMAKVQHILEVSTVDENNILVYNGEKLTSEWLQTMITQEFVANRLWSNASIVAVGDQAVMPHEHGSGFIRAGQSLVVDIFPRSLDNYYFSDMTRTFCKWKASAELAKMYQTVLEAQLFTIDAVRIGASGKDLHNRIRDFFEEKGYKTGIIDGMLQGFFHGTGHGVGLECHEYPYISRNGSILKAGQTVTVEPGLYYKGIGGVRIEDLVAVTDGAAENMTNYEKKLLIE
ncbi:MAG: M24 family metallopeptidase [Spirochaetales bacterium]|nr:M24 family metallopeptidase [Spirochaetales bacterium]